MSKTPVKKRVRDRRSERTGQGAPPDPTATITTITRQLDLISTHLGQCEEYVEALARRLPAQVDTCPDERPKSPEEPPALVSVLVDLDYRLQTLSELLEAVSKVV